MKPVLLSPGDIIEVPGNKTSHLYCIMGVYLGGLNQESLVELAPLNLTKGSTPKSTNAFVPLPMIEAGIDIGAFSWMPNPE